MSFIGEEGQSKLCESGYWGVIGTGRSGIVLRQGSLKSNKTLRALSTGKQTDQ